MAIFQLKKYEEKNYNTPPTTNQNNTEINYKDNDKNLLTIKVDDTISDIIIKLLYTKNIEVKELKNTNTKPDIEVVSLETVRIKGLGLLESLEAPYLFIFTKSEPFSTDKDESFLEKAIKRKTLIYTRTDFINLILQKSKNG